PPAARWSSASPSTEESPPRISEGHRFRESKMVSQDLPFTRHHRVIFASPLWVRAESGSPTRCGAKACRLEHGHGGRPVPHGGTVVATCAGSCVTPLGLVLGWTVSSRPRLSYVILLFLLDLQSSTPPVRPRADETALWPPTPRAPLGGRPRLVRPGNE